MSASRQEKPKERERSLPKSMLPGDECIVFIDTLNTRAANLLLQMVDEIDDLEHPIERALGSTRLIQTIMAAITEVKEVRRAAVKDAYEMGRSEPGGGWYGYSAIATQIGLSSSRVRQILLDLSVKTDGTLVIRDNEAEIIRELAGARRDAIRMLRAGKSEDQVTEETGISPLEVPAIATALKEH
jgi:hypothetical protein